MTLAQTRIWIEIETVGDLEDPFVNILQGFFLTGARGLTKV